MQAVVQASTHAACASRPAPRTAHASLARFLPGIVSMPKFKVLLTDYAWPELDIERRILAEIDAELVVASEQDEATLAGLATDVDAIMTNWAKVPSAVIHASPRC